MFMDHDRWHWIIAVLLVVLLALNFFDLGTNSSSQQKDLITVAGSGELVTTPDEASAMVSILSHAASAVEAQQWNADTSEEVMQVLEEAGVKKEDIETVSFSLNPRYWWNQEKQRQEQDGFEARHTLKIKTKDIEKIRSYLDAAVTGGAEEVNSIQFGLSRERQAEVQGEALKKASEQARAKAESLAKSLGVRLGKLSSVSESVGMTPPIFYARAELAMAEKETSLAPQDVEVQASVTLQYYIR